MKRLARVLIVDDAVVVRSALTRLLSEDPEIEVVGSAANGRLALRRAAQQDIDLVVLDIDMPEMDGLATLRALKEKFPRIRALMFSTLTETGAMATIEALSLGACDYVTKPSTSGGFEQATLKVKGELVRKIKAACFGESPTQSSALSMRRGTHVSDRPPTLPVDIVAIGTSTGGPNALASLLTGLPRDFPVPIVIVQHMPPMFTRILAERLHKLSKLSVYEAIEGGALEPGVVWIAQGGSHMIVSREKYACVRLSQDAQENFCRPAVDVLFRSVASAFGPRALAVVLTGMGRDGLSGSDQIRMLGGRVFAQDEQSSVVWGMPGYVVRANLAHEVLPLAELGAAIERTVWASRRHANSTNLPTVLESPGR